MRICCTPARRPEASLTHQPCPDPGTPHLWHAAGMPISGIRWCDARVSTVANRALVPPPARVSGRSSLNPSCCSDSFVPGRWAKPGGPHPCQLCCSALHLCCLAPAYFHLFFGTPLPPPSAADLARLVWKNGAAGWLTHTLARTPCGMNAHLHGLGHVTQPAAAAVAAATPTMLWLDMGGREPWTMCDLTIPPELHRSR